MTVNIFDTRTMLAMLEQKKPVRTFLLDTFFRNTEYSTTAYVDIDIIKGKRKMAPFVSPLKEGQLIERNGVQTNSFAPPYLKPKWATSAADLLKRSAGQNIYAGNASPAQKAAQQLVKDLDDMDKIITRREEWMAAQALDGGKIVVTGKGVNATIDFGRAAGNSIALLGDDRWTHADSTPLADLRKWRDQISKETGLVPDKAVFGQKVIDAFLAHEDTRKQLDTRRVDLGFIDPQVLAGQGVVYYGFVKDVGLDVYGYSEWYDDNGVEKPMVPEHKILLGSSQAQTARHYGAIQDLDFEGMASVRLFPKSWKKKDPSKQILLGQSAPLVVPHEVDAFASIAAVAE